MKKTRWTMMPLAYEICSIAFFVVAITTTWASISSLFTLSFVYSGILFVSLLLGVFLLSRKRDFAFKMGIWAVLGIDIAFLSLLLTYWVFLPHGG